ncbi:hypothetical protein FHG87_004495 [Trinorchestia longiramus]|nr:hypothetical protein FHG87_004495 [Trinorchestia longiramus]
MQASENSQPRAVLKTPNSPAAALSLQKEEAIPLHLVRRGAPTSDGNDRRMEKRDYPRWFQAYNYKEPRFESWKSSEQRAERKRFLPFHPLARFRGLSLTRGNSVGGGRGRSMSRGLDSLAGDLGERRWGGSITPFSDVLEPPMTAERSMALDSSFGAPEAPEISDPEDRAMEEAFRHRLGSVLGRGSGAREHEDVRVVDGNKDEEEELRAGELLQYLMAVNGKSNVGSSLRFGFTK